MTNAGRKGTVVLMGVLAILVPGRSSAQDGPVATSDQREATIVLHVVNLAAISREVLNQVKEHVAMVDEDIGVRTVWVDSEQAVGKHVDGGLHLTVMLLPRDNVKKISGQGISNDALGRAHPGIGRAYILCDRVRSMPGPKFFTIQLAAVIAHEVGHLVLPGKSHSRHGIMRANVDVQHPTHLPSFEKSQGSSIRAMLLEPPAGAAGR